MEDLGRIVIDVNATGGGAAGGGLASRMMQRAGGLLTKAGTGLLEGEGAVGRQVSGMIENMMGKGVAGATGGSMLLGAAAGAVALKKTFESLNAAAKQLTESLREFSPDVMIADATNEILMFQQKMQASAQSGAALARRELAQGRIDRAMFSMQAQLGRLGAIITGPLLESLASLIEAIAQKAVPAFESSLRGVTKFLYEGLKVAQYTNPLIYAIGGPVLEFYEGILNALNGIAANTAPVYQGNAPFISDLRLMGAKI